MESSHPSCSGPLQVQVCSSGLQSHEKTLSHVFPLVGITTFRFSTTWSSVWAVQPWSSNPGPDLQCLLSNKLEPSANKWSIPSAKLPGPHWRSCGLPNTWPRWLNIWIYLNPDGLKKWYIIWEKCRKITPPRCFQFFPKMLTIDGPPRCVFVPARKHRRALQAACGESVPAWKHRGQRTTVSKIRNGRFLVQKSALDKYLVLAPEQKVSFVLVL